MAGCACVCTCIRAWASELFGPVGSDGNIWRAASARVIKYVGALSPCTAMQAESEERMTKAWIIRCRKERVLESYHMSMMVTIDIRAEFNWASRLDLLHYADWISYWLPAMGAAMSQPSNALVTTIPAPSAQLGFYRDALYDIAVQIAPHVVAYHDATLALASSRSPASRSHPHSRSPRISSRRTCRNCSADPTYTVLAPVCVYAPLYRKPSHSSS